MVRRRYGELYNYVEAVLGVDEQQVREFFAHGMLMNVAATMDLTTLTKKEGWAERCVGRASSEAETQRNA